MKTTNKFYTIHDVMQANAAIKHHWFEAGAMSFFNTVIESVLIANKYFITSERVEVEDPKRYSIRKANPDGSVDTVGEFREFKSLYKAEKALNSIIGSKKS